MIMTFLLKTTDCIISSIQLRRADFLDTANRYLKMTPNLCRVLWDHRNHLRYHKEIREHQIAGRYHDPAASFAELSGICVVTFTLLYHSVRYVGTLS